MNTNTFTFKYGLDHSWQVEAPSWAAAWRRFWEAHPDQVSLVNGYSSTGVWVCTSESYPREEFTR